MDDKPTSPNIPNLSDNEGIATGVRHSLGWLVIANAVGIYLSLLLLKPAWQFGELTYGRWVPVHLNLQLYGWTSLPLVTWLISTYEVHRSKVAAWAPAAVWAWSAALAAGVCHWLGGVTSGKIFLDWQGGSLWAFTAAQVILWCVLAAAWRERSRAWTETRKRRTLAGLLGLALVPAVLIFAASPSVYPAIDRTTGGPTGSSLLGSALVVVGLMLLLPRLTATARGTGNNRPMWIFFGISWIFFGIVENRAGTHHEARQIISMLLLLPWVWWLPKDWSGFSWPEGSRIWRGAMFGWWALLVVSGLLMFQPGVLDRLKFTQGLVAHSHLAMAGFTTSFCALLLVLLTRKPLGGTISVATWHLAALAMVVTLAVAGWREGAGPDWMDARPAWRQAGFVARAHCGGLMFAVSLIWWWRRRKP